MTLSNLPYDPDKVSSARESSPQGTRRSFFSWMIGIAMSVIGGGLAIPLASYVISPALKRRKDLWAEVGPTGSLRTGEPEEL
ncbi:MAG: hypothetical protein ABI618_06235 [Nitrospirota bacterium]